MPVAVKLGRFHEGGVQGSNVETRCETFNNITDLFTEVGMIHVSEEDYPGQAGRFVTGTPDGWETQLVLPPSITQRTLEGVNLFRHPTIPGYFLVSYIVDHVSNSWRGNFFEITAYTGLVDGELQGFPSTVYRNFRISSSGSGGVDNAFHPMFASLGDDHFWIGTESLMYTPYYSVSNTAPVLITPTTLIGFALFGGVGWGAIISPQQASIASTGAGYALLTPDEAYTSHPNNGRTHIYGRQAQRCYTYFPGDPGWVEHNAGYACTLQSPRLAQVEDKIRISRAAIPVGGVLRQLNAAHCPGGSIADTALVNIDIGEGFGPYRCLWGFGSGCHYPSTGEAGATISDAALILLPWNE